MIQADSLAEGDKIIILAPSGQINPDISLSAAANLRQKGFRVDVFPTATGASHYFSGSIEQRKADFQTALDDADCKAVLCARGGYGLVQFIDALNWTEYKKSPKWIVGFSDITLAHCTLQSLGFASLHGGMAKEFAANSSSAMAVLSILKGNRSTVNWESKAIIKGSVTGTLVGGNLSVLCSLLGSSIVPNFEQSILFIEDVGEHLYKLDRMLWSLKLNGVFDKILGLVLGQFTDILDTTIPYGKSFVEIVKKHTEKWNIPVAYGLPSGHGSPNFPIVLGAQVYLKVEENTSSLSYL